jgi:O-6-methylguanine DNA methyltransferase
VKRGALRLVSMSRKDIAVATAAPVEVAAVAVFETAIGACGVAWRGRGLVGVQLPEGSAEAVRARLLARFPGALEGPPPAAVQRVIDGIVRLLAGGAPDLASAALDLEGLPPFHRRVYEAARALPAGATVSYGELAALVGAPGAARAVGQALRRNPFPIVVPCHRVLAAGGKAGGFTAAGGLATKLRLLAIEGAKGLVTAGRGRAARPPGPTRAARGPGA